LFRTYPHYCLINSESPRWLIQKNKPERALRILAHYFAFDDEHDVTVQFVHKEIETTLALEKEYAKYSIFEFFKTKGNRHRLLILVTLGFYSQWSGNAIISYYLTKVLDQVGITNEKEQLEINGGLGIWGWLIAVGSSLVIERFGRRKMFLLSTFFMMVVYVRSFRFFLT
jgi:Sugar (and other) transporter